MSAIACEECKTLRQEAAKRGWPGIQCNNGHTWIVEGPGANGSVVWRLGRKGETMGDPKTIEAKLEFWIRRCEELQARQARCARWIHAVLYAKTDQVEGLRLLAELEGREAHWPAGDAP